MNRDPLERAVENFYTHQSLRPEVLERLASLEALSTSPTPSESPAKSSDTGQDSPRRLWRLVAVAAAAAIIVGGIWLLRGDTSYATRAQIVAEEIARNHVKGLAVDYPSDDYEILAVRMDKLNFELVASSRTPEYRLLGGRYCSIQGDIAAQLKLTDPDGEVYTLYQAPWNDTYGVAMHDQVLDVGGVRVQLWREGELLFALASATAAH